MTKCPYVPPHPWNVDFPHLMLRAKAIKYRKGGVGAGEKLLASTDVHGQFAGIPVVVQAVNAVNRTRPMRKLMDKRAGRASRRLDARRSRPGASAGARPAKAAPRRSPTANARPARSRSSRPATSTTTSPASATTCSRSSSTTPFPYVIVEKERCCGMPKLELGDLDAVARHKEANIPVLARYAREGYAILSADPELHADVQAGTAADVPGRRGRRRRSRTAMFDPFEYLVARHKDGLLKTRLQDCAGQGQLPHPLPRPRPEDRPQDRGDVQADRADGAAVSSTRSSAAPAMPAPTA